MLQVFVIIKLLSIYSTALSLPEDNSASIKESNAVTTHEETKDLSKSNERDKKCNNFYNFCDL